MSIGTDLAKEFPRSSVSWRAQSLTRDKTKAMALAYIDARDVMNRLDEVCGVHGWQDEYAETPKGRVLCTIRLKIDDEWIGKSDGAGDTAVEGDKGGISDAFKRAAVKWGIGRYLYDIPAPWVPCETRNDRWSKWTADPWDFVRGAPPVSDDPRGTPTGPSNADIQHVKGTMLDMTELAELSAYWTALNSEQPALARTEGVIKVKDSMKAKLEATT